MEERVPSPPPPVLGPPPPPPPHIDANESHGPLLNVSNGTFVVQVPKDQVYRIPPPENARIAEIHRNSPAKGKKSSKCCRCVCVIVFMAIVLIFIGALLATLFTFLYTPKAPRFSIQRFHLNSKPHPRYNVTLQVHNPNSEVGISYKGRGDDVLLFSRRREIASGGYPSFYQAHHDSKVFGVALNGTSKAKVPKEVDESVTNDKKKVHVTFLITIHVHAQMKMWGLYSGTIKYDVKCQVTVDSLAKATRVLSQHCQTKRR